ncbi:MAG TPA: serine hydrolase domain-containing protein [Pyrinomonadaceae bacterium]|nr:serine hydrolase domain-containing protein [Pyrinomonadaceae bacterium]
MRRPPRLRPLRLLQVFAAFAVLAAAVSHAAAQAQLSPDLREKVDKLASDALAKSGVPSASVAVVRDGQVVYLKAYGDARVEPRVAAATTMRYSIGSVSKQFTAAAVLLLQEQGKLSLEDRLSKYFPELTRANEISIRQLLSHTSGYTDYWPQDYVPLFMQQPATSRKIMDAWARKPLDFEPGTKWQYSNTGYVVAGAVVEKVSGRPLLQFLREKFFAPLGMKSVADIDEGRLTESDATGYQRFALGPPRVAPKEGKGWLFAAAELAMTAEDLAKWDIAVMGRKILKPSSYRELETEIVLDNGLGTRYGLGLFVRSEAGRRSLSHGGEVSGFTAENVVFPDERLAVVALTNQDAIGVSSDIAHGVASLLFAASDALTLRKTEQARKIFEGLQRGSIDRSLFTDDANFYFGEQALKDFAGSLGPLGAPQEFTQTGQSLRGGMVGRFYSVKLKDRTLSAWTYETPDGKLEQFQVAPD